MQPIHLYASEQAPVQLLNVGLDVATLNRAVVLRPLSQLPPPELHHFPKLRQERAELEDAIYYTNLYLAKYGPASLDADAGRENGFRADLDRLEVRLRAVNAILGQQQAGA